MDDILYLVHRIPYPPNKGDKIRSFHILKFLSRHYRVHLGTFIDDESDLQHLEMLKQWATRVKAIRISPVLRKCLSLTGFLTREALSNRYYACPEMQRWVDDTLKQHQISRVLLFSSPMAQFVDGAQVERIAQAGSGIKRVMDFVDVDSQKWFQYAACHRFPMSYVYRREGRLLRQYELAIAQRFDASVFVSENEAELFRGFAGSIASKVLSVPNGVDTQAFDPARAYENPFPDAVKALVFTGAMDYWANIEAVSWFVRQVWPKVSTDNPGARFYIVGSKPTEAVRKLQEVAGVVVTGSVPEIKPYLAHAHACVAPLRIARGIQNKVLEALAMGKTVIATPEAMEGIGGLSGCENLALVTGDPDEMARAVLFAMSSPTVPATEAACRHYVERHFSWQSHLSRLLDILR